MKQVEIIYMAREAGLGWAEGLGGMPEFLERFANLVAQHEREACANLCEQHGYEHYCGNVTDKLAETIRARGQE
jgi:hypothetical protein